MTETSVFTASTVHILSTMGLSLVSDDIVQLAVALPPTAPPKQTTTVT